MSPLSQKVYPEPSKTGQLHLNRQVMSSLDHDHQPESMLKKRNKLYQIPIKGKTITGKYRGNGGINLLKIDENRDK